MNSYFYKISALPHCKALIMERSSDEFRKAVYMMIQGRGPLVSRKDVEESYALTENLRANALNFLDLMEERDELRAKVKELEHAPASKSGDSIISALRSELSRVQQQHSAEANVQLIDDPAQMIVGECATSCSQVFRITVENGHSFARCIFPAIKDGDGKCAMHSAKYVHAPSIVQPVAQKKTTSVASASYAAIAAKTVENTK